MANFKQNFISIGAIILVILEAHKASSQKDSRPQGLRSGYSYSPYQDGITCHAAQEPWRPSTLLQLQSYVASALQTNSTLKALGSIHSWTDVICTEGIPVSMRGIAHLAYNPATKLVSVGAGAGVEEVLNYLHPFGRTLEGIPSYGNVTVGGAIGCGSHGSSLRHSPTLSDEVEGMIVVDGLGQVRNLTDPEILKAFRVHLGLLGIVYEVTLRTVPQYKLHFRNYPQPDRILHEDGSISALLNSSDHLHLWWYPTGREVVLSVGSRVPNSSPGNCQTYMISEAPREVISPIADAIETMQGGRDHLGMFLLQQLSKLSAFTKVPGRTPIFTEDGIGMCSPAVGFSHRMRTNTCRACAWQHGNQSMHIYDTEVVIPVAQFQSAVATMRQIFAEYPVEFPMVGIFIRFLKGSDAHLAMNNVGGEGEDAVGVELVPIARKDRYSNPILGIGGIQAVVQALIQKHGGRPHWAKVGLHFLNPLLLRRYYGPRLDQFVKVMEEFDPRGVFLNGFGRRLRFGDRIGTEDARIKYCALLDHCICESHGDCGDGGEEALRCGEIGEYKVCKENERMEERSSAQRKFLNILKP